MKTKIRDIKISAISSYLPTNILELTSLAEEFGEKEVTNIIKATGIERVRIANENQTASDLCFEAALHLFDKEQIDKDKIDGLVFVSQTNDYILPSTSVILQDRLGLTKETICIDIHYGCSGYIYGLFQAALWVNSSGCENVLILSGDTTSKIISNKDKSLRMVFGDCGTATLVTKGDSVMGFSICSDGSGYDRLIIPAGGFRQRGSEDTKKLIYDQDKNGRTQEDLYMDGMAIFDFAISNVPKNISESIALMNWNKEDIALYAIHQANKFIVNCIRKKMMIEAEKMPVNIFNFGNTGPASIPLLLSDICSSSQYNLEKVILSGFGIGLSWGSVACNLQDTHFYEPVNK
jgi:3-oxoacyl-[acyl-carrier-protein] synthase-3